MNYLFSFGMVLTCVILQLNVVHLAEVSLACYYSDIVLSFSFITRKWCGFITVNYLRLNLHPIKTWASFISKDCIIFNNSFVYLKALASSSLASYYSIVLSLGTKTTEQNSSKRRVFCISFLTV